MANNIEKTSAVLKPDLFGSDSSDIKSILDLEQSEWPHTISSNLSDFERRTLARTDAARGRRLFPSTPTWFDRSGSLNPMFTLGTFITPGRYGIMSFKT